MRVFKNVSRALVLLAWSAVSVGQQAGAPPTPPPPAAAAPTPSPPPADREAEKPPPAAAPADVDEGEFIPSEELSPDAAITFPVDI